jgi:hypothetical protein
MKVRMEEEALKVLQEEWHSALDDAGLEVAQVRLYPFPGEASEDGSQAYHFAPGQELHYDPKFPDEAGCAIEDANKHRDKHRVAVWRDAPTPVLGAKLRHELEHAVQVEAHTNRIYDLNDLVLAVLGVKLADLTGGGQLYNAIPMEVDANAASARFAWNRYGEEMTRELADPASDLGKHGVLFRSMTPAAPVETLPARTLSFLFQFHDLCALLAEKAGNHLRNYSKRRGPVCQIPGRSSMLFVSPSHEAPCNSQDRDGPKEALPR